MNTRQIFLNFTFFYDAWNLIAEVDAQTGDLIRTYVWGLDLSGTMQGAGGIGGLLWVNVESGSHAGRYFAAYDGNGNVMGLISASDGSVVAQYEYGPFAEPLRATGLAAAENPLRFSTKYTDPETGLLYYGYRYYSPSLGRWLSRDPLSKISSLNLYCFTDNTPGERYDLWGLASKYSICKERVKKALKFEKTKSLINLLNKRNCKIPRVACKCCKGSKFKGVTGLYYPPRCLFGGNKIVICYNHIYVDTQFKYNMILLHEMYHAVQACYGDMKQEDPCKTCLCKEIEAAYQADTYMIKLPPKYRKAYIAASAKSSCTSPSKGACVGKSKDVLDRYVKELYEKCKEKER